MSKTTNTFAAFLVASSMVTCAVAQEGQRLAGATVVDHSHYTNLPNFIKLNANQQMAKESFVNWAVYALNVPDNSTFKAYETFTDELGYTHTRYKQYVNGYPVEGTQVISHMKEGKVTMVNGDYYRNFSSNSSATLTEMGALQYGLNKVNAKKYMWENGEFENAKKQITNNPNFTFYPKGELVYVHKKDADYSANNMRLAYKFNIYAEVPLYRANVFVDANTGEILDEHNLICTADVVGTGVTKYSGTVPMTSDNTSGPFRLREAGRGNGIETYNLNNSTTYTNTDFTNGSSTWNLPGNNQAAADAHWGAEMTYDYYKNVHSRNSIDGAGFKLLSYVHYSNNYVNAFWNGSEMTYGDGDVTQGFTIMTALDVCGHEITHGLTNFTAGLGGTGSGEPGQLNEGFSDIFGTTIEWYSRPTQHDWLMGADITPGGIRDMSNPKNLGQPNCYHGTNWDNTGEVHNDNGPCIFWYYLLCQGGSATNDQGNAYNVTGQTMAKARLIAFRGLTVYFTPSTAYANARTYTEQAATDIYGSCSAELTATSEAWYAVGVGGVPTSGSPTAAFSTGSIPTCGLPVSVTFNNTSSGAQSYAWTFGDGGTSTTASPTYNYTVAGTFTVTLVATGCGGGSTNTYTQTVTISAGGGAVLPLVEGFESSTTLPVGWTLWNPDNDAAWQISTTVAKTGTHCIGFNNCNGDGNTDMTGRRDRFITNTYSFTGMSSAAMTFDVAYALLTYSSVPYPDSLVIYSSTNCGTTWNQIYSKGGSVLATAPGYTNTATCWSPTAAQWRNDNINLSSVLGQGNVQFAFENRSRWGTWVYIDNINISGTTGISINNAGGMMIYPNPAHNNLTVQADQNIGSIQVIDMLGKSVLRQQPAGEKTVQVDISSLPAGIYFVKVSAGDAQKLIKLVKE
ncbi:MAG TPA: M4 family metallopeptidase [Bacteroidia bacterium]|jgi:Zn-dependent metalloprotease|nr:M4 family metallopeptidase [Bacteroidia bacterium]